MGADDAVKRSEVMSGLQGYLYKNKLSDAVITADVMPSAKSPLIYPLSKKGTGNIKIRGAFSGSNDKRLEVKILDTAVTLPVVSQPVFRGAGTGKIEDITVTGLEAQKIRVLCLSTGTNTTKAQVELEGLLFQAKHEGIGGNDIYIVIDDSMLVFTRTNYSTIKELRVGDTGLEGQEWDYETVALQGDKVPLTAKRIAFGEDRLNIYLQYKKFEEGKWKYYFITPIRQDVPTGKSVYFVTGGRKISVIKGAVTEEYTNIITIADFWREVKAKSTLIESPMVIDTSRAIDSPACREFATKTDAYFLMPYKADKSSEYAGQLDNIYINNNAKTELIKIECINNEIVGSELWEVSGSSTGRMGEARTGERAGFGFVGFTIPKRLPKLSAGERENWKHVVKYATRGIGVTPPPICFKMRLGVNAKAQTLTLEYKKKPADCLCPTIRFGDKCLGLNEEGGEIEMANTVPDLIFWTDAIYDRMREASSARELYENSFVTATTSYFNMFKKIAQRIMVAPEESVQIWRKSTSYVAGDIIRGMASDKWYLFECTTAGTSGSTEPTWPTIKNQTVNDGTAVWTNVMYYPALEKQVDDYKSLVKSLTGNYIISDSWLPSSSGNALIIKRTVNSVAYYYLQTTSGRSGSTEPTWPTTKNQTVNDGDAVWTCLGSEPPSISWNDELGTWNKLLDTSWAHVADTSFNLVLHGTLVDDILEYERYHGLKKNSIISGTCYIDDPDAEYYWDVIGDKAYLPAFTDTPYYSTVEMQLPDGDVRYENTKEFAFHISVPCGGTLIEGDKIEVKISADSINKTYQVGDITYLPTVAKQNIHFHGGVTGDNTYVFEVKGDQAFPNYYLDRGNPAPYSHTNLSFKITDGIVPFAIGDVFEFSVEGGRFVWREEGGSWSSPANISKEYQPLHDGLEIAFSFGVSPSFVVDDAWEILCIQTNKVANLLFPTRSKWKGTGNIVFSFSTPVTIDALVIDRHNLTSVRFQASNVPDFATLVFDDILTVSSLICRLYLEEPIEAQYYRLLLPSGTREIGYVFLGRVTRLSLDADRIKPMTRYQMVRTDSREPYSLYSHVNKGYSVNYASFITNDDYLTLIDMIDYLKKNNDMPFYFLPNVNYPNTCLRARVGIDTIEVDSDIDMNAPDADRIYSLALQIVGVE